MQTNRSFFHELFQISDELEKDDRVEGSPRKKGRVWINNFYPTWQEAAKASQQLDIDNYPKYQKLYRKDNRLPCNPDQFYADFPGWRLFFGRQKKIFYPTWQEAAEAARRLGIKGETEYFEKYKQDPLLYRNPQVAYADFPGWRKFIKGPDDYYPTWQEAAEAARRLGIKKSIEYYIMYKGDKRLPSNPDKFYADFPGFKKFLGKD